MIKKLILGLFILLPFITGAQIPAGSNIGAPTQRTNYVGGLSVMKYFKIPAGSGAPSPIASWFTAINGTKAGNMYYDSTNHVFYIHTGITWTTLGSQTLDQTLAVGNSTTRTINSGNIIPNSLDTTYNLASIGLRYKNIYSKRLFVGDTTNHTLNLPLYNFVLNGKMHTNSTAIFNDSFGYHTITIGEIGGKASIMIKGGALTLRPESGSNFSLDARDTKFYLYTNDMIFQGGQSTDGRELFLSDGNDTCAAIWNSNSLRGFYTNSIKIGGVATPPLVIASPTSLILDVVSTTQGARICPMNTTQRNAIVSPVNGLIIFNTTKGVMEIYDTQSTTSTWRVLGALLVSPNGTRWEATIDNSGNVTYTSIP